VSHLNESVETVLVTPLCQSCDQRARSREHREAGQMRAARHQRSSRATGSEHHARKQMTAESKEETGGQTD
jgi:hypothetical protein